MIPPSPFTPPRPLTEEETARVWRWEWWMVRVCLAGAALLALAFLIGWLSGSEQLTRRLVIAWFAALILIGLVAPLREGCPRCGKRLSNMWKFRLADRCRSCGVEFPRRSGPGKLS